MMKKVVPVRLVKNHFFDEVKKLEDKGATQEEFLHLLGKGRAKKGMLEGDLEHGELEAGQIAAIIKDLPTVDELVKRLLREYEEAISTLPKKI
jgi:enoyl-[acyl-carrier protein] reductase II